MSYKVSPLLLAAIKRILYRDMYTVYMLWERAVICRLNARWRKCTKMFTEALDLVRLSTVQSLSSSLLRRRITNVCWRPKCRCNGNRPGRAGAPSKGSQSQERNGQAWFLCGISFGYTRDTIVSAVRSPWNETLMYPVFLEKKKSVKNQRKIVIY